VKITGVFVKYNKALCQLETDVSLRPTHRPMGHRPDVF